MADAWIVVLVLGLSIASFVVIFAMSKQEGETAQPGAASNPADARPPVAASPVAPSPAVASSIPAAAFDEPDVLKIFGWILFLAGASLLVAAFVVSSSVEVSASSSLLGGYSGLMPDRVANMDKMNLKLMLAVAGGATMICGSIFIARK